MIHRKELLNIWQSLNEDVLAIERAEKSLSEFIKQSWHIIEPGAKYYHGWCIDAICEHLEAITNGEIKRLIINVPPGLMKSLTLNVFWPAWEWGAKKMPHLRYLSASHMMNLAVRDNIRMRRLVMSDWYQSRYPHVRLMKDQNAKIKFENQATGFKEAMASGSITGSRGDRVNIDDPLSVEDANSETILESQELWFTEAIPTRLNIPEKSAITIIMQRLSVRDTTAIALSRNLGYEHLMLPMEFEPERRCMTSIGFIDPREKEGELLFPERFTSEVVEQIKTSLGPYGTAGQFQQRPTLREGSIIKIEWLTRRFKLMRDIAGRVNIGEFKERYQSWDTAFKEGEENDYSVCTMWGVKEDGYYLIACVKMRCNFPTLEQRAIELANYFVPNQIFIEDKASGQSLIQAFKKRTKLPVKAIKDERDKVSRLNAVSGYFESNRIVLPDGEPWVEDYIEELTSFPAVKHDDQVDSTSQFLIEVALRRENSTTIHTPSIYGR